MSAALPGPSCPVPSHQFGISCVQPDAHPCNFKHPLLTHQPSAVHPPPLWACTPTSAVVPAADVRGAFAASQTCCDPCRPRTSPLETRLISEGQLAAGQALLHSPRPHMQPSRVCCTACLPSRTSRRVQGWSCPLQALKLELQPRPPPPLQLPPLAKLWGSRLLPRPPLPLGASLLPPPRSAMCCSSGEFRLWHLPATYTLGFRRNGAQQLASPPAGSLSKEPCNAACRGL